MKNGIFIPKILKPNLTKSIKNNNNNLNNLYIDQKNILKDLKEELSLEKIKKEQLKLKIQEINQFIEEYNLKEMKNLQNSLSNYFFGPPNFENFKTNIDILNNNFYQNEIILQKNGNIMKIIDKKPLKLILYSNGFILDSNEFRFYYNPLDALIIQSFDNKIFPFELTKKYPNGIKIEIIDKSMLWIII